MSGTATAVDGSIATGFEPQQDWLEAHYWLADFARTGGDRAHAAEPAQALLALWQEGDADLPMLVRTRQLLRTLTPAAR